MKNLLCFMLVLICFIPPCSFADELLVRGSIGKSEKLPPLTNQQLEEAINVSDGCRAYNYTNTRYECDCVGLKFLEIRRRRGDAASSFWIREEAQKKCPNEPAVAGMIYTDCLEWAPTSRERDYQSFCSCYGSNYAKIFGKNPTDNQLVVEAQMVQAMGKCSPNAPNEYQQDQEALIVKLKKSGVYDKLFPGAAGESTYIPPAIMPDNP